MSLHIHRCLLPTSTSSLLPLDRKGSTFFLDTNRMHVARWHHLRLGTLLLGPGPTGIVGDAIVVLGDTVNILLLLLEHGVSISNTFSLDLVCIILDHRTSSTPMPLAIHINSMLKSRRPRRSTSRLAGCAARAL